MQTNLKRAFIPFPLLFTIRPHFQANLTQWRSAGDIGYKQVCYHGIRQLARAFTFVLQTNSINDL